MSDRLCLSLQQQYKRRENGKETNVGVNVCASDANDDDKSSNDNSDNFCEGMGLPRWHTV
jgi:hypothetical protein